MLDLTKYTRNGRDTRLGFGLFVWWWKCGTSVGVVVTQRSNPRPSVESCWCPCRQYEHELRGLLIWADLIIRTMPNIILIYKLPFILLLSLSHFHPQSQLSIVAKRSPLTILLEPAFVCPHCLGSSTRSRVGQSPRTYFDIMIIVSYIAYDVE